MPMSLTKKAMLSGSEIQLSMADKSAEEIKELIDDDVEEHFIRGSLIQIEMIDGENVDIKKQPRPNGISNFHYRRTLYDVAFAISITDEILNLEPLEDKLCILKKKQTRTPFEIINSLRGRMTFFALYNLFDTVEHNHIDNQATMQKILIHMKKQESEIGRLNASIKKLETLFPLLVLVEDQEKLEKLNDLLERDDDMYTA